ncbi:MAG: hypothetical protein JWP25_97 [Bradyrhizobium sp.]|nr:hypothetical protein [Bradyrhizobium sp.]
MFQSRADLPKLAENDRGKATAEEARAVVGGSIAYYGTYFVNEADKSLSVTLDGATFANLLEGVQRRDITSLTADELKFSDPRTPSGMTLQTVWRHAKASVKIAPPQFAASLIPSAAHESGIGTNLTISDVRSPVAEGVRPDMVPTAQFGRDCPFSEISVDMKPGYPLAEPRLSCFDVSGTKSRWRSASRWIIWNTHCDG